MKHKDKKLANIQLDRPGQGYEGFENDFIPPEDTSVDLYISMTDTGTRNFRLPNGDCTGMVRARVNFSDESSPIEVAARLRELADAVESGEGGLVRHGQTLFDNKVSQKQL